MLEHPPSTPMTPTWAVTMRQVSMSMPVVSRSKTARVSAQLALASIHGVSICAAAVTPGSGACPSRCAGDAQAPRRMVWMTASPYAAQLARIPVREHRTTVLGTETAWWEYGRAEAPVLVLVHGLRGDHHGLEPVVAQLPGFRIIVPDLPGFGESAPLGRPHDIEGYTAWLAAFVGAGRPRWHIRAARALLRLDRDRGRRGRRARARALVLVNPIGAPALAGPRGVMTRLAVLYHRAAAACPSGPAPRCCATARSCGS